MIQRDTRRDRWILLIILGLTLIKGVLWSALTPMWQGPDEPSHFAVVQFIGELGRLPGPRDRNVSAEVGLSNQLSGCTDLPFSPGTQQTFGPGTEGPNERAIERLSSARRTELSSWSTAMHLPPLYYLLGAILYRLFYSGSILTRLFAVRQLSVLLVVFTVWIAYRATKLIFPNNSAMWVTVPMLVSFHPQLTFMGSVVNTDSMLVALSSWVLYLLLLVLDSGWTPLRVALLGLAMGLGALTKPQIWFLMPLIGVVFLWELLHRRLDWRRAIVFLLLGLAVLGLVCGWWFIRSQHLNNNIFYAELKSRNTPKPDTELGDFMWLYRGRLTGTLFQSYWGWFGWLDTPMSLGTYAVLQLIIVFAVLGIGIYVGKTWAGQHWGDKEIALSLHGLFVLTLLVAFGALGFWVYRKYGAIQPSQGRYFASAILSQMTLVAVGLSAFFPENWKRRGHLLIQAGIVLLNLTALFGELVTRYYAP